MKNKIALATFLSLMGCSAPPPPEPSADAAATSAQPASPAEVLVFQKGVAVAAANFMVPGVALSITPNPYDRCEFPKGAAPLSISYDARKAGAKHTQLWLQQRNGRQALWAQSPGRMDATTTGKWAHEGMKVLLVNLDDGRLLAVETIRAGACK